MLIQESEGGSEGRGELRDTGFFLCRALSTDRGRQTGLKQTFFGPFRNVNNYTINASFFF